MPADVVDTSGRREASTPGRPEPGTLVELFLDGLAAHRSTEAKRWRDDDGRWRSMSHAEFAEAVREAALGLGELGAERGDRVAILSRTRLEWALADLSLVMAGAVSVPVYPTLPPNQVAYILADAGDRTAFVEDQEQYDKLVEVKGELDELTHVVAFEPVEAYDGLPATTLAELRERGRGVSPEAAADYESRARGTRPDDLATLIYTSGTTGRPKGVMLSHDNFVSNVRASCEVLRVHEDDVALSWLPLAHVFERMSGHYLMWDRGATVAYAVSRDTIPRDMGEVRPTVMTAVPRLYEKLVEKAEAAAREAGGLKERIFRWARGVGERRADRVLAGESTGPLLGLQYAVADRLVFGKLRERTGGRIRFFISGGAPLPPPVGRFLWGAGLPVIEGYGLTETSPVLCVNPSERPKLGTVGPPIPGTELRIADDGEILARGPQVMQGYHGDEEATREVMLEDGWLRTGDVGELDEDGYLSITDRKKEILVLSTGKNVAPSPVENAMQRSRFVEYAVLIGDQRKFPIAVIQPAFEEVAKWADGEGVSLDADDEASVIGSAAVRELFDAEIREAVRSFDRHEQPGEALLVPDRFGVDSGELTPTDKVKRRVVLERYEQEIDRVYREAEQAGEGAGGMVHAVGER